MLPGVLESSVHWMEQTPSSAPFPSDQGSYTSPFLHREEAISEQYD